MRGNAISLVAAGVSLVASMSLCSVALAQDLSELLGKSEFQNYCAACHGAEGHGDGPMAELLKTPPADLTQISKNHNGKFPVVDVYQTIDGRRGLRAHGSQEMPLWGDRYRIETDETLKELHMPHEVNPETIVHGRILSLVYYIQSIQED